MPQALAFAGGMFGIGAGAAGVVAGTAAVAGTTAAAWGVGAAFAATTLGSLTVSLLTSTAISALQRALAPSPTGGGITLSTTVSGEDQPETIILGLYATGGFAVCPPYSHGPSNKYMTYVIELCSAPGATLQRFMLGDEWVTLGPADGTGYGQPVSSGKYSGRVWVKYYDGSQVVADPMLRERYGAHSSRPWTAEMIGAGICYAILTFQYDQEKLSQVPRYRFEMQGLPLYDPRFDSTVGGSGPQRINQPSTWTQTNNPIVMVWNIMRGLVLPSSETWGAGINDLTALPMAVWAAAMNRCDVAAAIAGGSEPMYRAGIEALLTEEPAATVEELLKAASATIADLGYGWGVAAGAPPLPVMTFSDEDVIVSQKQDLDPFPSLQDTYNAVSAKFPDPKHLWETKESPLRTNATWEALDAFGRRTASMSLPAVPYADQCQRLTQAWITDERRFIKHVISLPSDAAHVEPMDTVVWNSTRNSYAAKTFEIGEIVEDPRTGIRQLSLRECDASDWVMPPNYLLPTPPAPNPTEVVISLVDNFAVAPLSISDEHGVIRRGGIRMTWSPDLIADGLQWQVRLPAESVAVVAGTTQNISSGTFDVLGGLLPVTTYEVRARLIADRVTAWTGWLTVTTPDVRVTASDIADDVNELIAQAGLLAADAQTRIDAEAARITAEAQIAAEAIAAEAAAREAALTAEASAIRAEMLAEAEAKFPREVEIDTALNEIAARVTNLLIGLSETQSRIAGAGIFVDPESGTIKIEAVSRLDGELGEVKVILDAVAGSITLLTTKTYVDGAISEAVSAAILDPSQVPIIGDIILRLNSAELALSGAEAAIAAKASSLEVDAQGARLTAAELDIDGLQGEIALKASTTDLSAAEARITEAEAELSTIDGAAFNIGLRDIRLLGEAQDDQAVLTLSDLLRSYEDHETRRADIAYATQDLKALVTEDREATASLKTDLGARIDDTLALLASESVARASADEAEASQRAALAARVNNAELGVAGTSEAVSALTTRTTVAEGAITSQAAQLTNLISSVAATDAAVGTALTALETRTTEVEGAVTSQSSQITVLNNAITTNADTAASASAAALAAANAANTLAGGKGRVFFQTAAPAGADQSAQNLWIDTTGGANTPKRWSGSAWVAVTDKVATDAVAAAAAAATAAAAAQGKADTVDARLTNDYMTAATTTSAIAAAKTELNSTITSNAGAAAAASAAALDVANAANTLAGGKGRVFFQTAAPTGADRTAQNLWIDTTSGANTPKRWNGSAWVAVTDKVATDAVAAAAAAATAAAAAQGKADTVDARLTNDYMTAATTTSAIAAAKTELNSTITANASTAASASAAALTAANNANTLAGGKGRVFFQTAAPAGADQTSQNLWIDTTGGANTPKRWNGSAWVAVTDKVATDAVAAAAAAATAAAAAQGKADTVDARLTNDYMTAATTTSAIAAAKTELSSTISTKADASALSSLTTRTSAAEGAISSQAVAISGLNATVSDPATGLAATRAQVSSADQANATAILAVADRATTLEATAGSLAASISTQAMAVSTLEGKAAASLVMRARAGGAVGEIEVVAGDDPVNGPGSAVILKSDFFRFAGSLAEFFGDVKITGDLLVSADLITQSAQIGNGLITNAKIANGEVDNIKIANGAISTAKIGDLQVDTLKIAGNSVTVFRGARNTALANSTVNAWTTVAWVGFTPTDGANSLLAMVGAGMTLTSGPSGGGVTARGNARLLWRGNVVREFTDVMTLVAGGNTLKSPLAMTEILAAGWGYGELVFQISKGETAGTFTVDASLIAGEFKR